MLSRLEPLDQEGLSANFTTKILSSKVNENGIITNTDFWKLKRILLPKSLDLLLSISDHFGNDITDVNNIVNQYQNEFVHRLKKREILKNYRIRLVYLGCNPVKILSVLTLQ